MLLNEVKLAGELKRRGGSGRYERDLGYGNPGYRNLG
jgi:hypothetical protein